MKSTIVLSAAVCGLFLSIALPAFTEQPKRDRPMPAHLKAFVPANSFYSFHVQKGNLVFLQISNDPATEARNKNWPGGCASSRMINLATGQTFYIYESDGSYFCSNFHHDVVGDVEILSPYSVLIGLGGGGRCALSKRAVWVSHKRRYIIVQTREVWCDPK